MPHCFRRAFSLLELLLVIALLGILAALSLSGYSAILQATALTTGAQMVSDALTEARQDAITQNLTVEVRLYHLATAVQPIAAYRALQLHWLKPDLTTPALGRLLFLPSSVVLDASPVHSPLIAANAEIATPDPGDPHLDGETRVFRFFPDGSTDLDVTTAWFVTVRAAAVPASAPFPSDWACLTLNPGTGRVQIYRP